MRNPVSRFLLPALLALAAAACSSVRVTTDHDPTVDFSRLRTFAWMERPAGVPDPFGGNTLVENRVVSAIERELTARGMQPTQGPADFLVAVHTAARDRLDVTTWPSWGYGWRGRRFWGYGERVSVSQWTEGMLIVDFVDPASKDLLWRGVAHRALDSDSGSEESVGETVAKLLAEFPPGE